MRRRQEHKGFSDKKLFEETENKDKSYYYAQVDLYLESGQTQRALYQAIRNIAYNEDDPEAYINRARVYEKLGRIEKAILDLKEALRIAPDNENALQRLNVLERLNKPEHPSGDPS
ncbi:MAG: Tetratricopeptide repeat protein [Syntrophorhabdus sp. PtaB.Bin006]|nr:MAG: Tetratricopeptide repeat protein [Syntrophorhabdus sp. PtaB.Bin006]